MGEGVAGVGIDRAQGCLAGRHVVRVRGVDALPVAFRGLGEQSVRPALADHPAQVPAQIEGHLQLSVRVTQEDHVFDADLLGGCPLFALPDAADLRAGDLRVEAAGVTVGDDAVGDLQARLGPVRDRAGRTEVDVVGMGHDDQHPLHHVLVRHARPPALPDCCLLCPLLPRPLCGTQRQGDTAALRPGRSVGAAL